jgi:hypothetical protein
LICGKVRNYLIRPIDNNRVENPELFLNPGKHFRLCKYVILKVDIKEFFSFPGLKMVMAAAGIEQREN